mmetsp:Transcript_36178/g.104112  ORF Transcript_36178/g.104112 Transcript_36178/m.104112 type:complete len:235 (-) Transcript_36178:598-1302(-)
MGQSLRLRRAGSLCQEGRGTRCGRGLHQGPREERAARLRGAGRRGLLPEVDVRAGRLRDPRPEPLRLHRPEQRQPVLPLLAVRREAGEPEPLPGGLLRGPLHPLRRLWQARHEPLPHEPLPLRGARRRGALPAGLPPGAPGGPQGGARRPLVQRGLPGGVPRRPPGRVPRRGALHVLARGPHGARLLHLPAGLRGRRLLPGLELRRADGGHVLRALRKGHALRRPHRGSRPGAL